MEINKVKEKDQQNRIAELEEILQQLSDSCCKSNRTMIAVRASLTS